jgi:parallel beta-helix repeat protein
MKQILLAGLILMTPNLGYTAAYYVAKTGNDSTSCNQAQSVSTPKVTIKAGLRCMQGGDTLIIKAGTYTESIEPKAIPSGTASAQTVIKAAPGELVIIKPNGGNVYGDAVSIYDRSYITLDGLTLDGGRLRIGGGGKGAYSHYITVQNSVIRNSVNAGYQEFAQSCVTTQGQAGSNSHINYINNEIYNCGPVTGHGLYIHARDSVIEGNRIHHVAKFGIHLYHRKNPKEVNNNIIRYNEIYGNGAYGILISSGSGNVVHDNIVRDNSGGGIMIAYGPKNTQIDDNKIYDNKGDCIRIRANVHNTKVIKNYCWQNTRNRILDEGTATILSNNFFSLLPPAIQTPPAIPDPTGTDQSFRPDIPRNRP